MALVIIKQSTGTNVYLLFQNMNTETN